MMHAGLDLTSATRHHTHTPVPLLSGLPQAAMRARTSSSSSRLTISQLSPIVDATIGVAARDGSHRKIRRQMALLELWVDVIG